jgi:hypothetical protein
MSTNFVALTLADLKLGLHDLFTKREADLLLSRAGKYHALDLAEYREAIDNLPPALTGGTPLAEELGALDIEHDGFGGALYFFTEAYLRLPTATPQMKEAALRIREAFVPELGELSAPYVTEASRAMDRKPKLAELEADLKQFLVAPNGTTLLDVATGFIDAGTKLHEGLSKRADAPKPLGRGAASGLRSKSLGTLNRLRADLVKELKRDPKLPQDLEQRVFAYFDLLESRYASSASDGGSTGGTPAKGDGAAGAATKDGAPKDGATPADANTPPKP